MEVTAYTSILLQGFGRCPSFSRAVLVVVVRVNIAVPYIDNIQWARLLLTLGLVKSRFQNPVAIRGRVFFQGGLTSGFLIVECCLNQSLVDVGINSTWRRRLFKFSFFH